jgi:WD40 repeat protein
MRRLLFLTVVLVATAVIIVPCPAQETRPELVLQIGHMARITALAVSPDGELLASGSFDRTAKLWDASTGALRLSLPHRAAVQAIAFADQDTLLTAAADGSIRRWDIASGALREVRDGGNVDTTAAAFTGDGKLAAFALAGGKILLREVATGRTVTTLDGHPTPVLALAFAPDGKALASASDAYREKSASDEFARRAGDVRLWNVADGSLLRTLRGHALAVHSLAWSPDGQTLASVGTSGTAVLWNAKTFARLREINASEGQGRALAVAFSPAGSRVAVGWRGGVRLWEPGTASATPRWSTPSDEPITSVAFLPDGRLAIGARDGSVRILSADGKASTATHARMTPLTACRVAPDGHFIATTDARGIISLWNARAGTLERAWRGHTAAARDLAFSPDGNLLATVGMDGALRTWELPAGKLRYATNGSGGPLFSVAWSADGQTLATGGQSGAGQFGVALWNAADGKPQRRLTDANGQVLSLAYGSHGELAAATARGDSWGQLLLWDSDSRLQQREFVRGAHAVAFSSDGKRLLAGGALLDEDDDYAPAGDMAQLWNLTAGEMSREVTTKAAEARTLAVAFNTDDKSSVIASADGAIRLWDADGNNTLTLRGHTGPVRFVAVLPVATGATTLVSAGQDGTLRVWDAATGRQRAILLMLPSADANDNVPVGALLTPEWIAATPAGFFDGSPGVGRYVQWRVGNDVFPVEAFEAAFHRPAEVGKSIRGEAANAADAFETGQAVPPQVTITLPKAGQVVSDAITVKVTATDDKDLRSVQLLVNNRPATTQAVNRAAKPLEFGAKALEMGAKALEFGAKAIPASHQHEWELQLPATLPPADAAGVTLKVVATDGDGLQGADEIRLLRDGPVGPNGTLHVLAVGVASYANPAYNLQYAGADAEAFAGLWAPMRGRLFNAVEVTTLTDSRATSGAVREALGNIARSAQPNDVVAIFLSGHGVQGRDNEFFFATHDVNLDRLADASLPWTALRDALAASKARRIVLFLDACHSGGALGNRQAGNESMAEQLVRESGAVVFASSLGAQQSFELGDFHHGAFTQALIEAISQGKADLDAGAGRDGVINVEELLTFLRVRVPQLTAGAQMPACPLLRDFGEPFPLAKTK